MNQTALFEIHKSLGAKMVSFAGWSMPVEYKGLRPEHLATRKSVGIFDVSHMGEIFVRGEKSLDFLQRLLTNDVSRCKVGQAQYNMMLNPQGGVIDDLIIYHLKEHQEYLLVVNASNRSKDWDWILKQSQDWNSLSVVDESLNWSQVAVQGPQSVEVLEKLMPGASLISKFYSEWKEFLGESWLVARTGYTGEDGFEIYGSHSKIKDLWNTLMEEAALKDGEPCGLGARNTLRIEAGLPLYGNELHEDKVPLNLGLSWVLKRNKPQEFVGLQALAQAEESQILQKKLVALKTESRIIPRQGYKLMSFDDKHIGDVTSGTLSPSLNQPIAMAMLDKGYEGTECFIEVRKQRVKASIGKLPFV